MHFRCASVDFASRNSRIVLFLLLAQNQAASPKSALKNGQTVADLKDVCTTYGLPVSGRKADLIDRIKVHENVSAPTLLKRIGGSSAARDFSGMDANDDGRVTRSEARAYKSSPQTVPDTPTTVAQLKEKLVQLGLSTKGLKKDLEMRLADALDKLSGAAGSPAGGGEADAPETKADAEEEKTQEGDDDDKSAAESAMGEVVAADASSQPTLVPVLIGFAAVAACIAWHANNIGVVQWW